MGAGSLFGGRYAFCRDRRRPRRHAHSFFRREDTALPSVGHFWPQRPANFSLSCLRRPHFFQQRKGKVPRFRARVTFGRSGPLTFLFHASGGPISFSSERNGGKNAAKNQWFLEFLSSDHSHAAKRPTPNRSCPYPRCRFHVPQENAVSYRRGTVYLRVVRRSGSDKRTARDSLYDDVRQFKSRVVRGGGFQRTPAAQEVLKPAVSSSVFGHFWGCGQK